MLITPQILLLIKCPNFLSLTSPLLWEEHTFMYVSSIYFLKKTIFSCRVWLVIMIFVHHMRGFASMWYPFLEPVRDIYRNLPHIHIILGRAPIFFSICFWKSQHHDNRFIQFYLKRIMEIFTMSHQLFWSTLSYTYRCFIGDMELSTEKQIQPVFVWMLWRYRSKHYLLILLSQRKCVQFDLSWDIIYLC